MTYIGLALASLRRCTDVTVLLHLCDLALPFLAIVLRYLSLAYHLFCQRHASEDSEGFGLNESIVSISSNGEIILQLLRIEKHAAKTGEAEAGQLIAQARRIFEQREL